MNADQQFIDPQSNQTETEIEPRIAQTDVLLPEDESAGPEVNRVSAGLAGAAIGAAVGGKVAGRKGATVGAVIGAVAGGLMAEGGPEDAMHQMKDAAGEAVDKVKNTAANLKPTVDHAVEDAKDTAASLKASAAHNAEMAKDKVQDTAANLKSNVDHGVEMAKDKAQSTAADLKSSATHNVEMAKDKAQNTAANLKSNVEQGVDTAKSKASTMPSTSGRTSASGQTIELHEEQLIANKQRSQTGAVEIGKHVETEMKQVSVPVTKEKVVVERTQPSNTQPIDSSELDFQQGEIARMEIYEETADIQKQAFVREEVNVRKEQEQETVQVSEQIRREELDVKTEGHPRMERQ